MPTGCFIGIDQGSSATKAVAVSTDGQILFQVRKDLPVPLRDGARIEHETEDILRSVFDGLNEAVRTVQDAGVPVLGIGLSCQRSSCLAWNGLTGTPLTRVISWRDTRGQDLIERIRERGAAILRISGLPLTPYYSASKLRWIRENIESSKQPDTVFGPLSGFLVRQLTGNSPDVVDHASAARTQLMNIRTLAWDGELLGTFGLTGM
ncbi:MAG TPA: FGGY family carbohydrate kinase, partial [Nitrospirota bacterium]